MVLRSFIRLFFRKVVWASPGAMCMCALPIILGVLFVCCDLSTTPRHLKAACGVLLFRMTTTSLLWCF
jgi:hypothetical protein